MEKSIVKMLMRRPEIDNVFIRKRKIPWGTINPPFHYYDEKTNSFDVPMRDIVTTKMSNDNQFCGLNVGQPGCGKTIVNKRLLYYVQAMNYKCAVFDYKGYEWIYSKFFGSDVSLFPFEKPTMLKNIEPLIPSYRIDKVGPNILNFYKEYAHSLSDIGDMRELLSLGFTGSSSYDMLNAIKEGRGANAQELLDYFRKKSGMHGAVRESLSKRLIYLNSVNFFKEGKSVTLRDLWKNGKIPFFSLFAGKIEDVSFDFGKIIQKEYYTHKSDRRFILIDDGHKFVKKGKSSSDNMSTEAIMDDIYAQGRHKGWNMLLATQQPEFLNPEFIAAATHIIFSRIGILGDAMEKKIGNPTIIKTIKNLVYDKENHIKEKLIFCDDGSYQTFFPWGPILGHTLCGKHRKYKIF